VPQEPRKIGGELVLTGHLRIKSPSPTCERKKEEKESILRRKTSRENTSNIREVMTNTFGEAQTKKKDQRKKKALACHCHGTGEKSQFHHTVGKGRKEPSAGYLQGRKDQINGKRYQGKGRLPGLNSGYLPHMIPVP